MQRERVVDIAEVLRDARLGDLRRLREEPAEYDSLHSATARLLALLTKRKVDYLLVGGLAMLQYVEGRNTRDIDLIMAVSDLERLPEVVVESRDRDFARAAFEGVQLDLLLTGNDLFRTVKERYSAIRSFADGEIPTATVEGLILLKLFALPSLYRQGETVRAALYETDVRVLLDQYGPEVEPILNELAPHVLATDLAAVREIIGDIQGQIERGFPSGNEPA